MKTLTELLSESIVNEKYLGSCSTLDAIKYVKLDKDKEAALLELLKNIDTNVCVKAKSAGGEILRAIIYIILEFYVNDGTVYRVSGLQSYNDAGGAQNFLCGYIPERLFSKWDSKERYSKWLLRALEGVIEYLQENPDMFNKSISRRDNFETYSPKVYRGVQTGEYDWDEEDW